MQIIAVEIIYYVSPKHNLAPVPVSNLKGVIDYLLKVQMHSKH